MDYLVATHDLAEQPIVSIRERHVQAQLPDFLGRAFGQLFGHLRLLGVSPAGPPFVIYHQFGVADVDAEVSVPVSQPVSASGTIQARVLPAMIVARTLHLGRYEELAGAYAAITAWVPSHGFETAGVLRERYLNGPGEVASPAEYRTEVEVPIVSQAVVVAV
jgi:effector-binding domain-containing protein